MTRRPGPNQRVRRSRHGDLKADPKVRDWYDARKIRSELSADVYLRQLGLMLGRLELTPSDVFSMGSREPDELRRRLIRYAAGLKREGRLDSYVAKTFDGLRSFFVFSHVAFDGFPKLEPIRGESLRDERVPTPQELGRALDLLSLRGRLIALLMSQTGVRPGVIGSYRGEKGLTLGDLPELRFGREIRFSEIPFVVRVPAGLSKTRVAYTTFGSEQLASVLISSLSEREESGEELSASSPVVVAGETRGAAKISREARGTRFLSTKAVVSEVRDALKFAAPAGTNFRPYSLRSYCSTRLLLAEGNGLISRDLREAILGHDGGVAARYHVGKRWGDELLSAARAAYKRCEPFLSTTGKTEDTQEALTRAIRLLLTARGVPAAELKGLDLAGKTDPEIQEILRKIAASTAPEKRAEKAVAVDDVQKLLDAGWEFVSPLNGTMAVLRAPMGPNSGVYPPAPISG